MNELSHAYALCTPRLPATLLRGFLLLIAFSCAIEAADADTFVYDNAGRLSSVSQSNGLSHNYTPDEEANLLSATHSGSDTGGVGIPDWWQQFYFGQTGINPLASASNDGISNLTKYGLGLNPLVPDTNKLVSVVVQTGPDGKGYFVFTYICAIDDAAAVFMEQSSDGVTWVYGSQYFQQLSAQDLGDGTEQITVQCLTALPQASSLHFRLATLGGSSGDVSYYTVANPQGIPVSRWTLLLLALLLPVIMLRRLGKRPAAI